MNQHITPAPRRTFLRQLLSLPLIGGAVTLIGSPTRAAVPTTDAMVATYGAFCLSEAQHIRQRFEGRGVRLDLTLSTAWGEHGHLFPCADGFSSRVPVILSAAGVALARPPVSRWPDISTGATLSGMIRA